MLYLMGGTDCIHYRAATIRTYSDIFFIKDPDCSYTISFSKPPQELPAANQVSTDWDQLPLIMVAQYAVMAYPDKPFRRNVGARI